MKKNIRENLFLVADRQQGYFTSQQAEKCGYHRSHFSRFLKSGEWVKEFRGIYRLGRYPVQDRSELVFWILWSRDKQGNPRGVWSHETALDIHELSDVMPVKMHMTVPPNFRRRLEIPKILFLHRQTLEKSDIEERQGYKVTTPLKTLIDIIEVGTVADNFILQTVDQAVERGIILKKEIRALQKDHPSIHQKLTRLFNERHL